MKYVISDSEFEPVVVIGNREVSHLALRSAFPGRVGGAGHFDIEDGKVVVYGKSIGLDMEAKDSDAEILAAYLHLTA